MNKLKWVFLRKSQFTTLSKRFVPRLRTRFCITDPEFAVMTTRAFHLKNKLTYFRKAKDILISSERQIFLLRQALMAAK